MLYILLYSIKYFLDNQSTSGMNESIGRLQINRSITESHEVVEEREEGVVAQQSPLYWRSDVGQRAIKSLPLVAPPLDFRQLKWKDSEDEEQNDGEDDGFDQQPDEDSGAINGRLVSTAHPAVGSALSAARRNASKRAATAPE